MRNSSSSLPIRLRSVSARYRQAASRRELALASPSQKLLLGGGKAEDDTQTSASPTARTSEMARLEAILFLAREPLTSRKLAKLANLEDGTKARSLVRRLAGLYDVGGYAFRVEEVAGGYQLLTRRKFASWLRRLAHIPGEMRLSGPALETLGVVAYRQPVLRAEIESIRGVQCGEILRQLMERDLVRIAGRSTELGRPFQYGTTRRFLQLFGLRHLDDLPRSEEFRRGENQFSAVVANQTPEGNDIRFIESNSDKEESNVTVADLVKDDELLEVLHGLPVVAAYADDEDDLDEDEDDEDLDDDEDDDDLEEEDDDYDYEDDDEEYEDDDEEDLEEELEGDWEEVDDEEEDEEEEEDDDEEDDYDDDDDEEEDEDWEEDDE